VVEKLLLLFGGEQHRGGFIEVHVDDVDAHFLLQEFLLQVSPVVLLHRLYVRDEWRGLLLVNETVPLDVGEPGMADDVAGVIL
jgi:hypothetical protein